MFKRPLEANARATQEAHHHRANALRREISDLERKLRDAPPAMEKALNDHIARKRRELEQIERPKRRR